MSEKLRSMDEIRAIAEEEERRKAEQEETPVEHTEVVAVEETKSITDLSVGDIKMKLDSSKSMEEQAEDIVGAMATAKAVQDEKTAEELTKKKAEQLIAKADEKKKKAEAEETKAEVERQEANRSKYEAVLQTFGINKHLPNWLLYIMVAIFSPIYIVLTLVIGLPCGVVKVLIDDIDNILVRYGKADEENKPKIKATVWILLVLATVGAVAFTILKCLNKI